MQRDELAPPVDVERLARVLAAQAAEILDIPLDEAEVDLTASLYAPNGFRLGDRILDSQQLFEMVVTLEEETGVLLLDALGVRRETGLIDLARLVADRADPERIAELLHPSPGVPDLGGGSL
jgi:acyl carrier protein